MDRRWLSRPLASCIASLDFFYVRDGLWEQEYMQACHRDQHPGLHRDLERDAGQLPLCVLGNALGLDRD